MASKALIRYIRQHHLGLIAIFIALVGTAYAGNQANVSKRRVKVGPPGPVGAQGPQGLQGPQGSQGTPGTNGSPDTAAQVLGKLLTVDGPGSMLDADKLDGLDSTAFPRSDANYVVLNPPNSSGQTFTDANFLTLPGIGRLSAQCREQSTAKLGKLIFENTSAIQVAVTWHNDLASGEIRQDVLPTGTLDTGETPADNTVQLEIVGKDQVNPPPAAHITAAFRTPDGTGCDFWGQAVSSP